MILDKAVHTQIYVRQISTSMPLVLCASFMGHFACWDYPVNVLNLKAFGPYFKTRLSERKGTRAFEKTSECCFKFWVKMWAFPIAPTHLRFTFCPGLGPRVLPAHGHTPRLFERNCQTNQRIPPLFWAIYGIHHDFQIWT